MRTLILSDLHLGTPASRALGILDALRPVTRTFERVILNGDTLDRYEAPGCQPQSEHLLVSVREALCSAGGPPEFISGNHDPAISETQWIYDAPSQTLVFHGDIIRDWTHRTKRSDQLLAAHLASVWKRIGGRPTRIRELSEIYRREQLAHLQQYPPDDYKPKPAWLYLALVLVPPQKPFHVLSYWHAAPRLAADLAVSFDAPVRTAVVGHTHRSGRWTVNGLDVLNTGSHMPFSTPHAVILDGAATPRFLPVAELLQEHARAVKQPASPHSTKVPQREYSA